jgi:hypothetical protein
MDNNNKILQELQEYSPLLLQVKNNNPYQIPLSYFSELSNTILEKIKLDTDVKLFLSRDMPYFIPTGYFENFSDTLLHKVTTQEFKNEVFDEMEKISPFINRISKNPVYNTPVNYFEEKKWEKPFLEQKSKVVAINRLRRIVGFLAAAIIIALLAVGIFMFVGKEDTNTKAHHVEAISEVEKLSKQEIEEFIKTASPTENIASTVGTDRQKNNDIKRAVSKMSDEEIQEFLQENGEKDKM